MKTKLCFGIETIIILLLEQYKSAKDQENINEKLHNDNNKIFSLYLVYLNYWSGGNIYGWYFTCAN